MFRGFTVLLGLVLSQFTLAERVSGSEPSSFHLAVSAGLESVKVTIQPERLPLRDFDRSVWQRIHRIENAVVRNRRLVVKDGKKPVTYRADLTTSDSRRFARIEGVRFTDWSEWLLMPVDWTMEKPVELSVDVPGNQRAVLPFRMTGPGRYLAEPILPWLGGIAAFGDLTAKVIAPDVTAVFTGEAKQIHMNWLRKVVDAAETSHGLAPAGNALIMVVPRPFGRGAVPWAHVKRGGGSHVIAYVNDSASEAQLLADWTLFHEVTHLYHPYLEGRDRWVSEGFASYFQNLYRSRVGLVSADFAYERLVEGLERGRRENQHAGGVRVTEGGRMRTYWTGAALALAGDAAINEYSDGRMSLGIAMGIFVRDSMPTTSPWRARRYLNQLDAIVGKEILVPLYEEYVRDRDFPRVEIRREQAMVLFGGG